MLTHTDAHTQTNHMSHTLTLTQSGNFSIFNKAAKQGEWGLCGDTEGGGGAIQKQMNRGRGRNTAGERAGQRGDGEENQTQYWLTAIGARTDYIIPMLWHQKSPHRQSARFKSRP